MVYLTPRQTGYIVRNLKPESKVIVLEKIKRWYFEEFLVKTKKGFDTISKQFNEGDPFIESDHENRIFDIHGDRKMEVPYTEWTIMGNLLAPSFLFGVTCFDHGDIDGYKRADNFLRALDDHRKGAIDLALGLIKNFKE